MNDLLRSRGVPKELIRQLINMGPLGETLRICLEQASDQELKTIIDKWKGAAK